MMEISLNDMPCRVDTAEELTRFLDRLAQASPCEVWLTAENESSLSMLKQDGFAWLMYMRYPGDSGFVSIGNKAAAGKAWFTLSNGQMDEYPVAWCVELAQALKAISHFLGNHGARADWIKWWETQPGDKW